MTIDTFALGVFDASLHSDFDSSPYPRKLAASKHVSYLRHLRFGSPTPRGHLSIHSSLFQYTRRCAFQILLFLKESPQFNICQRPVYSPSYQA